MLHRPLFAGFIAPCLPTKTDKLPSGDLWLHEIKHDGFRVIARKDGDRVRLYSRQTRLDSARTRGRWRGRAGQACRERHGGFGIRFILSPSLPLGRFKRPGLLH
jgi:hypothetical protein